jgi:hypothetical protein
MAAPRKQFVCKCGKETDKTVSSYYAQIKRLGYVLCTECSLKRSATNTSLRLKAKYQNKKNTDIITFNCEICGKPRKVQRRAQRDGYTKCKSCAAKINRLQNADLYNKLAEERLDNQEFSKCVSKGILNVPEEVRSKRSKATHAIRWENNREDRLQIFIDKSINLHGSKYDYSLVEYVNHITPVIIICREHGKFKRTPKQHALNGYGCPRCSELRTISSGHAQIAEYIQSFGSISLENNTRSIIPPYEIDIWLPDRLIGIEYHGVYWHSFREPETARQKQLHQRKADTAHQNNITLLQIFETEWIQKPAIIKSIIAAKLGYTNTIYARKCDIKTPSNKEYANFMDQNHLQGYRPSSYKIGLYYNNELQAAIGISKHPTEFYELIRLATRQHTTVVGGISKLLAKAQNDLHMPQLLTYADRRYSIGRGYLACGFAHIKNTSPNYFYTTGDKNQSLSSRQSYQKHKLKRKLPHFDENLSEPINMFYNGWRRIWDAGHMKFIKFFNERKK